MMRRLIRADGTAQDFDKPVAMVEIRRLIGADTIDTVNLRHMGSPLHVMACDGNAWECEVGETPTGIALKPIRALRPINAEATRLYLLNCIPGTTHQIAGDVFVCPDDDFASPEDYRL